MLNYNLLIVFLIIIFSLAIAVVIFKTKIIGNIITSLSILFIVIAKNNEVLEYVSNLLNISMVNLLIVIYSLNFICSSTYLCKSNKLTDLYKRKQSLLEQTVSKLANIEFLNFKKDLEMNIPKLKDSNLTAFSVYIDRPNLSKYMLFVLSRKNLDKNKFSQWIFKKSYTIRHIKKISVFGDSNNINLLSNITTKASKFIAKETLDTYCFQIAPLSALNLPNTEYSLDINKNFSHLLYFSRIGSSPKYEFLKECVHIQIYLNLDDKNPINGKEYEIIRNLCKEHFKLFETLIESIK